MPWVALQWDQCMFVAEGIYPPTPSPVLALRGCWPLLNGSDIQAKAEQTRRGGSKSAGGSSALL